LIEAKLVKTCTGASATRHLVKLCTGIIKRNVREKKRERGGLQECAGEDGRERLAMDMRNS